MYEVYQRARIAIPKEIDDVTQWKWDVVDEVEWNDGKVFCFSGRTKIKDGPPKKCCYLVEQFLYHDSMQEVMKGVME